MKPLVKWSGGKKDEIPKISPHIPEKYKTYIEPFVGGGALYFHLKPNSAVIADVHKELTDFYKILTICELLLSKYESRKFTYQNMKKFVDILDSTIESLEMMNGKIDELTISADFSMKKIKELESSLLNSKTDTYQ